MSKYCVIVPAAGKSERFGGEEKKTFAKLDGRPVFLRTVELFINREDVCQTILAVAPEDVGQMKSMYGANLGFLDIQLVEGGPRRFDTIQAALMVVSPKAEFIAVHDAARPCVAPDRIDAVFAAAVKNGAAILGCPVSGTLKRVRDRMIVAETVDRTGVYEAQTPQAFRKELLLEAYEKFGAKEKGLADQATDDAWVVERAGHSVTIVPSDPTNLKITTKSDLTLAAAILKSRPSRPSPRLGAFEEAQW
jgi:2-C-methyl-D-erythritol 4-phosphate cytidylyltransferase